MVIRQCLSLPAALTNRSLFLPKDSGLVAAYRRGFQSLSKSRSGRIKAGARKTGSAKKAPPPVVSLTGAKPVPNVYRDFSDGDNESGDETSVIQLKASSSQRAAAARKKREVVRRPKPPKKELRFSDSEDEEDEEVEARLNENDDEEDDEDDSEGDQEEEGLPDSEVSKRRMVTIPKEAEPRGILYEKFVPQHLEGKPTRQLFGSNIHVRAEGSRVMVNRVEFIKSSSNVSECPMDGFPEFAFVGRSNVGKSSLVNLLVERRKLALVSKKPGKTQLINHFLVNKSYYLVDLPGYGFAVAPKSVCVEWNEFTKDFFLKRKTLVMVIQLVDAAIPPQQIDIDCATWLKKQNIPMTLAFTKCDKRRKKKRGGKHVMENVVEFLQRLRIVSSQTYPWILTSCITGQGREELLLHMEEYRKFWHS